MPGRSKKQQEQEPPSIAIPRIFDQVQGSTANHQKNFVALHKVHLQAAKQVEPINNGKSVKLVGERAFEDAALDALTRVLPVKKGVAVADRVVKFMGGYVKFANEKAGERLDGDQPEDEDEDEETTAARFVNRLLKHLLRGFSAKDKSVRFRCVGLVAEMVSYLGEIDEEVYQLLRSSLMDRISDKESPVRVQAVIGLSKLCGSEEPGDVEDGEQTATETLLGLLAQEPAADVRRAALLNIPATQATLPAILDRTRDVEGVIRRLVYSAVLAPHATHPAKGAARGVAHPRALSIAQRELIVRNGLGDRAPEVRKAVARLLVAWMDVAVDDDPDLEPPDAMRSLLAFLNMFDLNAGTIAEDALLCIFTTRGSDLLDALAFDDTFWQKELSSEKAFLVRVFTQHCLASKDEKRLEGALPVITDLAIRIMNDYNDLRERTQEDARLASMEEDTEDEVAVREEARMDREFALGELLRIAVGMDYGDENGRRKMFQLIKDMISQEALPESLVPKCLDVLRELTPSEKELIRIVVEVVHELRDDPEEELPPMDADQTMASVATSMRGARAAKKPSTGLSPEEKARADRMDLRCLSLCIAMLERVNSTFEENSTLEGILQELIVPSVQRKEMQFREQGLHCLGLCCLIARRMAHRSMPLFIKQVESSPELLRMRVLQIIIDILMVHDQEFLSESNPNATTYVQFLTQRLVKEDSSQVEALICTGLAKLVLSGMITDSEVLHTLIVTFISPHTSDNHELRQCLSYFFPVYSYSSQANQNLMQKLFVPIYEQVAAAYKTDTDDDDSDKIAPAQIAMMFVDWTDPQKAVGAADAMVHFNLAEAIVKDALLGKNKLDKDDRKALYQIFSKLHLPDDVDEDRVRTLKTLVDKLKSTRAPSETASKNALNKFDAAIGKKYEKQLEGFTEEDFLKLEKCEELKAFLDEIIPLDDEDEEEQPKKRATRKRRSESVATDASLERDTTPKAGKRKPTSGRSAKRRKVSTAASDSDDDESVEEATPPARSVPKRAAATKRQSIIEVEEEREDEEDEDEDEEVSTPVPRPSSSRAQGNRQQATTEDSVHSDEEPDDSIFDSDEE